MNIEPKNTVRDIDEVGREWAANGAKVLARVALGDCHLDNEGWWVETSTGRLIGIDPETERPLLSDREVAAAEEARTEWLSKKKMVTMRLDRDVLERLKADGPGWQTRANAILRKAAGLET